jgi:hypothetical protein
LGHGLLPFSVLTLVLTLFPPDLLPLFVRHLSSTNPFPRPPGLIFIFVPFGHVYQINKTPQSVIISKQCEIIPAILVISLSASRIFLGVDMESVYQVEAADLLCKKTLVDHNTMPKRSDISSPHNISFYI